MSVILPMGLSHDTTSSDHEATFWSPRWQRTWSGPPLRQVTGGVRTLSRTRRPLDCSWMDGHVMGLLAAASSHFGLELRHSEKTSDDQFSCWTTLAWLLADLPDGLLGPAGPCFGHFSWSRLWPSQKMRHWWPTGHHFTVVVFIGSVTTFNKLQIINIIYLIWY